MVLVKVYFLPVELLLVHVV